MSAATTAMLDFPLSDRQVQSIREATGRVNVWDGSIRSGKTIASLLRWLIYVASAPRGGQLVVVARTRDSAARNVFGPLQDPTLFGHVAASHVAYTAGAPTARILDRQVHVLGASDAKAEKVLRGMTVAGAYVDEATVIPEEFFTQLLGRMSVPGAQCFATTNPDNPAHWLKTRFLDRIGDLRGWRRWQFRLTDNPSLTAEYVASITAEYTGLWYRRFILGEWVAAEGAVFDCWDPDRHVIAADRLPDLRAWVGLGVDHGTTNPSAAVLVGLGVDGRLYAADEWWLDGSTLPAKPTVGQQSASLREWMSERPAPQHVPVDPAAAAFRAQLHADGVRGVTEGDNDVKYGLPLVASLLAAGRLYVTGQCTNLIREIPGYAWDPKATEKGEDKPIKVADHSIDALRYGVVSTEPLWHRHVRVQHTRERAA